MIFILTALITEISEWNDVMDVELSAIPFLRNATILAFVAIALSYCFSYAVPFRAIIRQTSAAPAGMSLAMEMFTTPFAMTFHVTKLQRICAQTIRFPNNLISAVSTIHRDTVVFWMGFTAWISTFSAPFVITFSGAKIVLRFHIGAAGKFLKWLTAILAHKISRIWLSCLMIMDIPTNTGTKYLFFMPAIIKRFTANLTSFVRHNKNLQRVYRYLVQGMPTTIGGKINYTRHRWPLAFPERDNYTITGGARFPSL